MFLPRFNPSKILLWASSKPDGAPLQGLAVFGARKT